MKFTPLETPAPWRAEKIQRGYVVRDANGQPIAYVSSRMTEAEALQENVLTDEEGHIIATCIAQLPQLLRAGRDGT